MNSVILLGEESLPPERTTEHVAKHTKNGQQNRQKHTCTVCGEASDGLHFGAVACRACAAFFRRTIARRLNYSCRFDNDCEFAKNSRAMCRSCRLAKCFAVGMNHRAVISEYRSDSKRPSRVGHLRDESMVRCARSLSPLQRSDEVHFPSSNDDYSPATSWSNGTSNIAGMDGTPELRLQALIESNSIVDLLSPPASSGHLPAELPAQPALRRMALAYAHVQHQRDLHFGQARDSRGQPTRVYAVKTEINYLEFLKRIRLELNWIIQFMHHIDGFAGLAIQDKMVFLKHYWINFVVLDRNFDSYRVLSRLGLLTDYDPSGGCKTVFQNGDIVDMEKCEFNFAELLAPQPGKNCGYRPWFRHSKMLCEPTRELAPSETEMLFTLGIMLWKMPPDQTAKLSPEGLATANAMAKLLYGELADYYKGLGLQAVLNPLERVAEMMRIIAYTEKVTMWRKEDIILARTFKIFKIDVYLEEIFGPVEF